MYQLQLTAREAIYLADTLPNDLRALLLRVGSCVLSEGGTIQVSAEDLWAIRDVAKSHVVVGQERVGINLLIKAYTGLLYLDAAPVVEDITWEVTHDDSAH